MKTLEMTTSELAGASRALAELMEATRPFRLGLALRRVARQIESAVRDAAELERAVVERHARRDDAGELVPGRDDAGEVKPGSVQLADVRACYAELDALRRTPVKVQVEPLTPEDFRDPGPDVAPWVLLALGGLMDDEAPAARA